MRDFDLFDSYITNKVNTLILRVARTTLKKYTSLFILLQAIKATQQYRKCIFVNRKIKLKLGNEIGKEKVLLNVLLN